MVCAYYDREANDRELFEKRLIAKCPPIETESKSITWDMYLGKYDVIRIVMTDFIKSDQDVSIGLQKLHKLVVRDLAKGYPDRLEAYRGNILLVGINYNRDAKNTSDEFKHHTCDIERA